MTRRQCCYKAAAVKCLHTWELEIVGQSNAGVDENTDEEAYRWLEKMIWNVERTDGRIDEY